MALQNKYISTFGRLAKIYDSIISTFRRLPVWPKYVTSIICTCAAIFVYVGQNGGAIGKVTFYTDFPLFSQQNMPKNVILPLPPPNPRFPNSPPTLWANFSLLRMLFGIVNYIFCVFWCPSLKKTSTNKLIHSPPKPPIPQKSPKIVGF